MTHYICLCELTGDLHVITPEAKCELCPLMETGATHGSDEKFKELTPENVQEAFNFLAKRERDKKCQ